MYFLSHVGQMYFVSHPGQSETYLFTDDNQFLLTFATQHYAQWFVNWASVAEKEEVNWRIYQLNSDFTMQEREAFLDEEARYFRLWLSRTCGDNERLSSRNIKVFSVCS